MNMIISYKIILYLIITPLVAYSVDSLNINAIFKKNSVLKARFLYFLIVVSLSYLVVGFLDDIFTY
ncbi:MAG: DUF1146 family protein [Bacilli bacterium]|nr:DUF1146 family protein [Bacilli bacterium]